MAKADTLYDNDASPKDKAPSKGEQVAGRYLDPATDQDAEGMLLMDEASRDPGNKIPDHVEKKILKMGRDAAAKKRRESGT